MRHVKTRSVIHWVLSWKHVGGTWDVPLRAHDSDGNSAHGVDDFSSVAF